MKCKLSALILCFALCLTLIPQAAFAIDSSLDVRISEAGILSWPEYEGAYQYEVAIKSGTLNGDEFISTTSFDLKQFLDSYEKETGYYLVYVYARDKNNASLAMGSASYQYRSNLTRLQEPQNLQWIGSAARWSPVPNTESYELILYNPDGKANQRNIVSETEFDFGSSANKVNMYFTVSASADGYRSSNVAESGNKPDTSHSIVVSFIPGKGSGSMKPVILKPDSSGNATYQLPSCSFTAPSAFYDFDAWESNKIVNGRLYNHKPGDTGLLTENITLSANWVNNKKIPVRIDSNGSGTGTVSGDGVYSIGETVVIKAIPDSGSRFVEWSYKSPYSGSFSNDEIYSFAMPDDEGVVNQTHPLEITATFERIPVTESVTITFEANGGTGSMSPIKHTQVLFLLSLPTAVFLPLQEKHLETSGLS